MLEFDGNFVARVDMGSLYTMSLKKQLQPFTSLLSDLSSLRRSAGNIYPRPVNPAATARYSVALPLDCGSSCNYISWVGDAAPFWTLLSAAAHHFHKAP